MIYQIALYVAVIGFVCIGTAWGNWRLISQIALWSGAVIAAAGLAEAIWS